MNILSQIVPGLRDARTPFAVGLIWAIAGWLAASLLPKTVLHERIITDAAAQIGKLPTEVVISLAVFLIYVSGILLNAALGLVRRLTVIAAGLSAAGLVALTMLALMRFLVVCAACALMIVAMWALARWKRLREGTYWQSLEDCLSMIFKVLARKIDQTIVYYRRALESDSQIFDELVDQELELYFDRNGEFLLEAVTKLNRKLLYQAAIAVGITLEEVHPYAAQDERDKFRFLKNLYDLSLQRRKRAEEVDGDLRQALHEKLSASAEARRTFARSALDYSELRGILRRRLERAELVLRSEKPDVFMDYDRVRSEGELRSSVGLPVTGLLSVAAYEWHLVFHSTESLAAFYWLCAAAAVIGAALYSAGGSLIKKSNRMLYISVRSGLISIKQDEGFNEGVLVFVEPSGGIARTSIAKFVVRQATRDATERIAAKVLPKYAEAYKAIGSPPPPEGTSDLVPAHGDTGQRQADRT